MMNPEMYLQAQNQADYNLNQENAEPVYNLGRPQTRDEMRENLQEDGKMTHDEIEEWLDTLEQ
jgi:adenine-specific DNA methylase